VAYTANIMKFDGHAGAAAAAAVAAAPSLSHSNSHRDAFLLAEEAVVATGSPGSSSSINNINSDVDQVRDVSPEAMSQHAADGGDQEDCVIC
jgi:hypothetical protein